MSDGLVYLDNAATTFPKPIEVLQGMVDAYARVGVSPGRGNHDLAMQADDRVAQARARVARFFGAPDPDRVIFAANATDALNTAIGGIVRPGDHVVATRLDHNSVLRPLHHLADTVQKPVILQVTMRVKKPHLRRFFHHGHLMTREKAESTGCYQHLISQQWQRMIETR